MYFWISGFVHRAIVLDKMHIVHWAVYWTNNTRTNESIQIEFVEFGKSFSSQRLLFSEWEPYLLKTYFCEHTFKAISSIYQKIIRLYVKVVYCNPLSTKGKGELVAKWAKENVSDLIGYSVGLMSQWARLTPCFFCNASMPFQVRRFFLSGDFTLQENLDDLSSWVSQPIHWRPCQE